MNLEVHSLTATLNPSHSPCRYIIHHRFNFLTSASSLQNTLLTKFAPLRRRSSSSSSLRRASKPSRQSSTSLDRGKIASLKSLTDTASNDDTNALTEQQKQPKAAVVDDVDLVFILPTPKAARYLAYRLRRAYTTAIAVTMETHRDELDGTLVNGDGGIKRTDSFLRST